MTGDIAAFDCLCAAALRGETAAWPRQAQTPEALDTLHRRLHFHGIAGLLFARRDLLKDWPDALLVLMRNESMVRAMWEMRHKLLLAEVIATLHAADVRSLVLKGTAYAYSLYPEPAQRFRGDTDLLVAAGDLAPARTVLKRLGWQRPGGAPGPFGPMHYQELWQYHDRAGLTHDIDLHWEVTNSRALRSVLETEQVLAEARALPGLSPHALRAEPVTALIHRAINRAAHAQSGYFSIDQLEYDPDRLLWAVDLDLLARSLSSREWQSLAERAVTAGIAPIMRDALGFAQANLHTGVPDGIIDALAHAARDTPATRFLTPGGNLLPLLADLKATSGFRARTRFLLARALPSATHMRRKYPDRATWPLLGLYLIRFVDAGAAILRRRAT